MLKNKFFYGWVIVFAAICLVFLDGLLLYSFGVLLPSIQAKFEMSKAAVNSIFAIRCIVFAFSMILFGKLIDKHRPEKVIFLGGLITAIGLFFTAYSDTKLTLFLNYGVLTGLGDGAFYIPAVAIVQRWFNKRRDFAVGLVTAGVPISGLMINPLSAWILSVSTLETTLMSLAGITLICLLPAFLMKQDPGEMGLTPYGGPFPKSDDDESNNWETKEATKTSAFVILYVLLFLGMLSFLIVVTLQFDYAISNNLNLLASSIAPASIAAGSFCGRLVTGYLADSINRNKILFSVFLGQGLSVLILLNGNSLLHYSLFGFFFGFSYGGWIPIFPSLLKDFFGKKHVGQIFGVFGTGFSISAIIGPPLAGYLVDEFNTYNYGFYVCIVACIIAAMMALLIKKPIKG
ncbi:MFS transporter [bacterium]|jgi:MFS family permease|nr:MFS transporter [bacterium]MBT3795304.1 MFS transporter [bacterium]MBT4633946.1 MFS transporter [bacterium]